MKIIVDYPQISCAVCGMILYATFLMTLFITFHDPMLHKGCTCRVGETQLGAQKVQALFMKCDWSMEKRIGVYDTLSDAEQAVRAVECEFHK